MRQKLLLVFAVALALIWTGSQARAHVLWLLVEQSSPKVGKPVKVDIGWGHKFPKDEDIKEGRLGAIKALGPDGQEFPLKKISTTQYEFTPPKAGVYVVSAQVVPGFLSKTAEGFKLQKKTEVPGAVSCFHFDMSTKTVLNVGGPRQGFDRSVRTALEIVPRKNPNTLKAGDTLPVKVYFEGAPLAGAEVKAAQEKPADSKKPFFLVGKTNAQGEVQVKLDQPGKWLLVTFHKTPYQPAAECDDNRYTASLTFIVR
ncbi:MAG: DUF4198 domain-containing protein [Thermodesulfobacteriota bacterium]